MRFAHTWALLAFAAVAVPLLIHYLTRPRPRRMALSTVRFVIQVLQHRKARFRLRDFLLLALRVAAVLLLALAFARPLARLRGSLISEASSQTVRVVILDQSTAMAAQSHGIAAFDRAKPIAARYLDFASGAGGDLILSAARSRAVFGRPSSNAAALREELSCAHARPEELNLKSALNLAGEILAKSSAAQRRELVVISAMQRADWASADFSPLPNDTVIAIESVAQAQRPDNFAVLAVRSAGHLQKGREGRIDVEVGNYSSANHDLQVELTLGDGVYQAHGLVRADSTAVLSITVSPAATGWLSGSARLKGIEDALKLDDARYFAVEVRPAPTYLLLTRESAKPQPLSSHFVERALAPFVAAPDQPLPARVVRLAAESLDREAVGTSDMIVIDHPGKLSAQAIALLTAEMRHGKSILYIAAETVDASNLKLLSDAAGSDMKMPVEFSPATGQQSRRNLFLTEIKAKEAPFSTFGDSAAAAAGTLRFSGGLSSRAAAGGLPDDILATFSDRTAALLVTPCGAGKLAVLNADLQFSSLPISPMFVPLMSELVNRLMGQRSGDEGAICGENTAAYLPSSIGNTGGLTISGPGGAGDFGTLTEESSAVVWHWPVAGEPGVYTVTRNNVPVFALATVPPAKESNLQAIDPDLLKERLSGGRTLYYQSASDDAEPRDRAWAWLAVACIGCLLAELGVLKFFKT